MIAVHRRDLPRATSRRLAVKMRADKDLPLAEEFKRALAGYKPASPRHEAILKSWREYPSNDDLWRALKSAAAKNGRPPPDPTEFIGMVLGSSMPASRINDHSKRVLNQFEALKAKIADVVNGAIFPLDLWRDLERFEPALRELDRSAYDMHTPAGGRKDQNHSHDRKFFAARMSRYFKDSCGQPLSGQVTKMLDIVFPHISHDERLVREWLKVTSPRT